MVLERNLIDEDILRREGCECFDCLVQYGRDGELNGILGSETGVEMFDVALEYGTGGGRHSFDYIVSGQWTGRMRERDEGGGAETVAGSGGGCRGAAGAADSGWVDGHGEVAVAHSLYSLVGLGMVSGGIK